MQNKRIITPPFSSDLIRSLHAGDMVYITGTIYTARDAAHQRLVEMLDQGLPMPFHFEGQVVYYAGPCPAKPGQPIGSVGPTTAGRMDPYSLRLIAEGLKVMVGKGLRSTEVIESLKVHTGVFLAAIGGAAALMGQSVKKARVIAFPDLGPEAVRELYVEELPVIVAVDCYGRDAYAEGRTAYEQN